MGKITIARIGNGFYVKAASAQSPRSIYSYPEKPKTYWKVWLTDGHSEYSVQVKADDKADAIRAALLDAEPGDYVISSEKM